MTSLLRSFGMAVMHVSCTIDLMHMLLCACEFDLQRCSKRKARTDAATAKLHPNMSVPLPQSMPA
jgi:hypothetical protein